MSFTLFDAEDGERDLGMFEGETPAIGEVVEIDGRGGRSRWYEVIRRSWRCVPMQTRPYATAFVFVKQTNRRHGE